METSVPPLHDCRCSQKLDALEKNGNCSYPVGEKVAQPGVALRGRLPCWQEQQHGMAQRSVRDPFVYLFVNEGDETG